MKPFNRLAALLFIQIALISSYGLSQSRPNIFVVSREKKKKPDFTADYILARAYINALHAPGKFVVIRASSSEAAARKIEKIMRHRKTNIGSLWFDSHGHYGDRYASFTIGRDKFSWHNIGDTNCTRHLKRIARYCDERTRVGLGACYAGADYTFPATDTSEAVPMRGDSLLAGLGNVFSQTPIYGSKSWVMARPGMFTRKYGLVGNMPQRRYKDVVFTPVWESMGQWTVYHPKADTCIPAATVSITRWGDIRVQEDYNSHPQNAKKINRKKASLQPGLARFK
ncbi:hypothetical protein [Flavihumibacter petaseus]|uniref:Uncharacterized protein n=1 Tax=Flavihumibacter petaseus NBRC 106054 TaxID=1220578 RepID=A0A0E9N0L6_9BACT|nr:hypothetical protein [Flavihumibacter petaseus]GAO43547.1 hypothetical protein FPE01S_02_06520 [Flavihumibacter petaseus NBRC 106054]